MKQEQKENKKEKLPFLFFVVIWYFSAYTFEIGYFLYFEIPLTLIEISFSNLISLGFWSSIIILLLSVIYKTNIIPVSKSYWVKHNRVIVLLHILAISGIVVYLSGMNKYIFVAWIVYPLLFWFNYPSEKREGIKIEKKISSPRDEMVVDGVLIVLLSVMVSTTFGYIYAVNKKEFLRTDEYIILSINEKKAIATKEINQKKPVIKIINLEGKEILYHKK